MSKRHLFRWRRSRVGTLEKEGFTNLEAEWIAGLQVPLNPRPTGKRKQTASLLSVSNLILRWRRRRASDTRALASKGLSSSKIVAFFENNEDDSIYLMLDEYEAGLWVCEDEERDPSYSLR